MAKEFKMYQWKDRRRLEDGSLIFTEEFCAVKSFDELVRLLKANGKRAEVGYMRNYGGWSGNIDIIDRALAKPYTIFYTNEKTSYRNDTVYVEAEYIGAKNEN